MTGKRILGYIFIVLASILSLSIIGQLPSLFETIIGIFFIFTGRLSAEKTGMIIGQTIFWVFYLILTIYVWEAGIKRVKKNEKTKI